MIFVAQQGLIYTVIADTEVKHAATRQPDKLRGPGFVVFDLAAKGVGIAEGGNNRGHHRIRDKPRAVFVDMKANRAMAALFGTAAIRPTNPAKHGIETGIDKFLQRLAVKLGCFVALGDQPLELAALARNKQKYPDFEQYNRNRDEH
ncbi:MAG: hypothetical protein PVI70_18645 [Gammaproteobacteria bacterium]